MKKLFAENFDKLMAFALVLVLVSVWIYSKATFLETLINTTVGGLLGILTGKILQSTNVNAEKIQTGDIKPDLDLTAPEAIQAVEQIKEEK